MFGLGKKKTAAASGVDAAGAMFNLVRRQWPDVEEAKRVAAFVLLLGDTELYRIAPGFKDYPLHHRTLAVAMFASISKSYTGQFGKDGALKLFQGAADYAGLYNETEFFASMRKSLHIA